MKRSERLVDMVKYLTAHPHTLIALPFFANKYKAAKSSISEDLAIIKHTFAINEDGILETVSGAAGGVRYIPFIGKKKARKYLNNLANIIEEPDRILPGEFVYLSDILGSPQALKRIGQLIATKYAYSNLDYVMTVETKGLSIAQIVGQFLNIPFVLVRRKPKITEGATISVNYVSSSSDRIEKMELAKKSLAEHSNVLIVDDFMKGGGTLTGMKELVEEFNCTVAGMIVLCESKSSSQKVVKNYQSLVKISKVDRSKKLIKVESGNYLVQTNFDRF